MKSLVLQKFSVVPTVVILDKDEISLYTGENAFDWFAQLNNESVPDWRLCDESVPDPEGIWRRSSLCDESVPVSQQVKPQATPEEGGTTGNGRQIPSGSTKSLLEIATELAKERDNSQPQRPATAKKNQKNEIDFKKNL